MKIKPWTVSELRRMLSIDDESMLSTEKFPSWIEKAVKTGVLSSGVACSVMEMVRRGK